MFTSFVFGYRKKYVFILTQITSFFSTLGKGEDKEKKLHRQENKTRGKNVLF
jgi:hypothetical protein